MASTPNNPMPSYYLLPSDGAFLEMENIMRNISTSLDAVVEFSRSSALIARLSNLTEETTVLVALATRANLIGRASKAADEMAFFAQTGLAVANRTHEELDAASAVMGEVQRIVNDIDGRNIVEKLDGVASFALDVTQRVSPSTLAAAAYVISIVPCVLVAILLLMCAIGASLRIGQRPFPAALDERRVVDRSSSESPLVTISPDDHEKNRQSLVKT